MISVTKWNQKRNSSRYLRMDSTRDYITYTTGLEKLYNPDLAAVDREK